MKCPNCGSENDNNARFCRNCGEKLSEKPRKTGDNTKIIVALVAIIIILGCGVIYSTGILAPPVAMQTQQFEGFSIDVPTDSDFVLAESYTTDPETIFVGYINNGEHSQMSLDSRSQQIQQKK